MPLPYENATSGKNAVEVGMLSFDGAFLGRILLADGSTVLQRIETDKLLALPDETS